MLLPTPTEAHAKQAAKYLLDTLKPHYPHMKLGFCHELIARLHGFESWNHLKAAAKHKHERPEYNVAGIDTRPEELKALMEASTGVLSGGERVVQELYFHTAPILDDLLTRFTPAELGQLLAAFQRVPPRDLEAHDDEGDIVHVGAEAFAAHVESLPEEERSRVKSTIAFVRQHLERNKNKRWYRLEELRQKTETLAYPLHVYLDHRNSDMIAEGTTLRHYFGSKAELDEWLEDIASVAPQGGYDNYLIETGVELRENYVGLPDQISDLKL